MKKDITTNNLIENNDVFADIANVNLWNGDILLKPEDLESVPINTSYKDIDGKHHQLFRDNLKRVKNRDGCIAFLGCEAQTSINNVMPVRNMGYNYTVYMRQIQKLVSENNRRKHSAYAKVLHDNQKLLPVATFVLYFGNEKWQHPLSLMDILDIPEENKKFWRQLIHDYKITVIPMADQPEEIRAKYQSDYKIIADYLALHKNDLGVKRYVLFER